MRLFLALHAEVKVWGWENVLCSSRLDENILRESLPALVFVLVLCVISVFGGLWELSRPLG